MSAIPICTSRDFLDVLSAVGPTVAAGVAVIVSVWAVVVARQSTAATKAGVDLQRALSNPRLSILERVFPDGGTVEWVVELQNSGISPGSITTFKVFGNDKEIDHLPMQSAAEFWMAVFMAVGIKQFGRFKGDYWRSRNVDGGATVSLFSAVFTSPRPQIAACMRQIRIEIDYAALTGYRFKLVKNLGASQAPVEGT
jgi:hypothetical protein